MLFREAIQRKHQFALAGPCGAGKTTLARKLLARNPTDIYVVHELTAAGEVSAANIPIGHALVRYQQSLFEYRKSQAIEKAHCKVLVFDRSFEEDREIFLTLFYELGYLNLDQFNYLKQLSIRCERPVGPLEATLLLTAPSDVLRKRLMTADQPRPKWIVDHLDLLCELYDRWKSKRTGTIMVQDTSLFDPDSLVATAEHFFKISVP